MNENDRLVFLAQHAAGFWQNIDDVDGEILQRGDVIFVLGNTTKKSRLVHVLTRFGVGFIWGRSCKWVK